jgi:hypothetical protein
VLDPRLNARAGGGIDAGQVPAEHQVEAPSRVASVCDNDLTHAARRFGLC